MTSVRDKLKFHYRTKRYFWVIFGLFLSTPLWFVKAQAPGGETLPESTGRLESPIKSKSFSEFIESILDIVITIGIPIVALAIIYSGFLFVEARGNPDKLKKAKSAFMWTIVGAAVLLGSWLLAQAIGETIEQIRTG